MICSFPVSKLSSHDENIKAARPFIATTFTVFMCIFGLEAIFVIPTTLYHLKGARKVFIVAQKLCILGHHVFFVLPMVLVQRSFLESLGKAADLMNSNSYTGLLSNFSFSTLFNFLRQLFLYEYFFLSLMLSVDIYWMVCHPLSYSEFNNIKSITKMLFLGSAACLISSFDSFLSIFLTPLEFHRLSKDHKYLPFGIEVVSVTKWLTLKVVYAIVCVKIAAMIKTSLAESTKISKNANRRSLYQRLKFFSLIPFFLNFIHIGHEILHIRFMVLTDIFTEDLEFLLQFMRTESVCMYLTFGIFMVSSFVYDIGLMVLFPRIWQYSSCCKP